MNVTTFLSSSVKKQLGGPRPEARLIDGLLPKLPRFQAHIPSINLVFKQYTIESMVYFSRLPKFASPVGYEELSQSKTAKYFE